MMTAKLIQLTTCIFLLFQLKFETANSYEYYFDGSGNLRPINYPQLSNRIAPVISSRSDVSSNNQNVQNARSQISGGSENFSFEMFHVS